MNSGYSDAIAMRIKDRANSRTPVKLVRIPAVLGPFRIASKYPRDRLYSRFHVPMTQ